MSSRALQFIDQSQPNNATLNKQQLRVIRSQAARTTHAETRRLRTISHQARVHAQRSQLAAHGRRPDTVAAPAIIGLLVSYRSDPFTSLPRPLKPIEHFLLDHYLTAVVPLMRCDELASYYMDRMTRAWVPLALNDAGLLGCLFLAACRHLSENCQRQRQFRQLAVRYKLECVRSLMESISAQLSYNNATVAKAVMLAYDELMGHDVDMSRHHIEAAVSMVKLNGGPQSLGLDGFLEHMISKLQQKLCSMNDLDTREVYIGSSWN